MPTITTSSASPTSTVTISCYSFQDPDTGPAPPQCVCDGIPGTFPYLSSISGQSNFDPCHYTTLPIAAPVSSLPGFTTTESDGDILSCASSAYYNYAINTTPTCAGSRRLIGMVTSTAHGQSPSMVSSLSTTLIASISTVLATPWPSTTAVRSAQCPDSFAGAFWNPVLILKGSFGWGGIDDEKCDKPRPPLELTGVLIPPTVEAESGGFHGTRTTGIVD